MLQRWAFRPRRRRVGFASELMLDVKGQTLRAILCEAWGTPDRLRWSNVTQRPLESGQARIRVHGCGVNFADILMVGGTYQVKPAFPFSPGLEAAGEVVETASDVTSVASGDRVLAVSRFGGSYAEELVVDARAVVRIPDSMDFITAAGFPVAYGTSYFALTHRGKLQAGEWLVVAGAAGGVGLTAVEIGKHMGAKVIAIAGGEEKCAVARDHGADATIDHKTDNISERIKELTSGQGADVVYDPVGGDVFDACMKAVNWEARMLLIGFAGGRIQSVPANRVLVKNISIIGVVWGAQAARDPVLISDQQRKLLDWHLKGYLKPRISATFPLAKAGDAMAALQSRKYPGKIVLSTMEG
jgi:NADPH:quinone reductase